MSEAEDTFVVRRRSFTVVYDDQMRAGMSLRAWGLYCYLAGRPPGWECRVHDVVERFAEGRDAVRTARAELVDLGLVVKEPYLEAGLRRYRWILDMERSPSSRPETDSQAPGNPRAGNPAPGNPRAGNPPGVKKEAVRTDLPNTDPEGRPPTASPDAAAPGRDALFDLPGPPPPEPAVPQPETEGQRVNRLTTGYTDAVPLSKFAAVAGIVRAAVRAERAGRRLYPDDEIAAALARLAAEGRPVTTDTLRVALEGLAPGPRPGRVTAADENLARGRDLAARQRARHQQNGATA